MDNSRLKFILENIEDVPESFFTLAGILQKMTDYESFRRYWGSNLPEVIESIKRICSELDFPLMYAFKNFSLTEMEFLVEKEHLFVDLEKYAPEIFRWALDLRKNDHPRKDLIIEILKHPSCKSLTFWQRNQNVETLLKNDGFDLDLIKTLYNNNFDFSLIMMKDVKTINHCLRVIISGAARDPSSLAYLKILYAKGLNLEPKPLKCPICKDEDLRIIVLGCGHTICLECFVKNRMMTESSYRNRCSVCRQGILHAIACL